MAEVESKTDLTGERECLFLNTENSKSYKCEPLVVITILDHHKRRTEQQHRVIGTLLGTEDRGEILISNCFPLIHREEGDKVVIDQLFKRQMTDLHAHMNPNERIVGWYVTGNNIDYNCTEIHETYRDECSDPVLMCVDTELTDDKLSVKAYHGSSISVPDAKDPKKEVRLVARFDTVPFALDASQAEKIAVDVSISGRPDNKDIFDSPSSIIPDIDSLQLALADLMRDISDIDEYVDHVLNGKIQGDPAIGREIVNALAAIPHIDSKTFDKMFAHNIQNLLMVVYLSSLTQTQLQISNKIGQVL